MSADRRLRILHVILVLGETNSQYNEHCLPSIGARDLAICTYFPPRLRPPPEIALYRGNGTPWGFFAALRKAFRDGPYDAVHVHNPQTGTMLLLAFLAGIGTGAWRSSVYTVHDSFGDFKPRNKLLMIPVFAGFRRVVFCGHAAYASLPSRLQWLIGGRARVVQNGADFERIDRALARRRADSDHRPFTIAALCQRAVKDPLTLVDAFRRCGVPGARLIVIGEAAAGLDRALQPADMTEAVVGTGLLARDDVYARFAECSLFVSTSRGEGLPVAVLEAMGCGCPVVLSDIPPHRELTAGASFIPLVAQRDATGFAREIARIAAMPAREREALGTACSEHARRGFSVSAMSAGYDAVYRGLR